MKNQRSIRFYFLLAVALSIALGLVVLESRSVAAVNSPLMVTNTDDSGSGSLRQAIQDANATAGTDTIEFNIPATDPNCNAITHVCTITPASELPLITDSVTIDGYTQPGASPNALVVGDNAVLLIEISGATIGGNPGSCGEGRGLTFGLCLRNGSSTIRG